MYKRQTEEVLDEAEQTGCDLIVTHHPIVFHALKRFNSATYVERCVERAIRRGIALYACHTNLDSAPGGMSWRLAEMLGVEELRVLQPTDPADGRVGFGVVGELPQSMSVRDFMRRIQERLPVQVIRHSELVKEQVRRVAVCTGAGASLLGEARRAHQARHAVGFRNGAGVGKHRQRQVGRQQCPGEMLQGHYHLYSVLTLMEPMLSMATSWAAEAL